MKTTMQVRPLIVAGSIVVALVLTAGPVSAQHWSMGLGGGMAFPADDLDRLVEPGFSGHGMLRFSASPSLELVGAASVDFFGQQQERPAVNQAHLTVGAAYDFTNPGSDLRISGVTSAGITRFEIKAFVARLGPVPERGETHSLLEYYPNLFAGLEAGYPLDTGIELLLRGGTRVVFADEEDTAVVETISLETRRLSRAWSFPVSLGVVVDAF